MAGLVWLWNQPAGGTNADVHPGSVGRVATTNTDVITAAANVTSGNVSAIRTVNLPAVTVSALAAEAGLIFFWRAPPQPASPTAGNVQAIASFPAPVIYSDATANAVGRAATVPTPLITQDGLPTAGPVAPVAWFPEPLVTATTGQATGVAMAGLIFLWTGATPNADVTVGDIQPAAVVWNYPIVASDANITLSAVSADANVNNATAVDTLVSPQVIGTANVPAPFISVNAGSLSQAGLIFLWSSGEGNELVFVGNVHAAATVPTPVVAPADANVTVEPTIAVATVSSPTTNTDLNAFQDDAFQDDAFQQPTGGAQVTAGAVVATGTVPTPGVTTGPNASVTAGNVQAVATVPTPVLPIDVGVTAGAVGRAATVPTPGVDTGGSATATVGIGRSATVNVPSITGATIVFASNKVLVAGTGKVYVAPVGTPAPTDPTSSLNAAFTELGFLAEGADIREMKDLVQVSRWSTLDPSRSIVLKRNLIVAFALREWNRRTIELAVDGTVSGGGPYTYSPPAVTSTQDKAMVIDWQDGVESFRLYIPTGRVTEGFETTLSRGGAADLPITFTATSYGEPTYTLFTDASDFTPLPASVNVTAGSIAGAATVLLPTVTAGDSASVTSTTVARAATVPTPNVSISSNVRGYLGGYIGGY